MIITQCENNILRRFHFYSVGKTRYFTAEKCNEIWYFIVKNVLKQNINSLGSPINRICGTGLKKYATHLFTTPLSNVTSDNMMSRLIFTLTKQFFDNLYTHFKIKLEKFYVQRKS